MIEQRTNGGRQVARTKPCTDVTPQVERGHHRPAAGAELVARKREIGVSIECLLLGLQQIQAELPIVIHGRGDARRQSLEQYAPNGQAAAMDAGSDGRVLQTKY